MDLPHEALISVLLMLEPGHISFVAATARAFRQVLRNPELWRHHVLRRGGNDFPKDVPMAWRLRLAALIRDEVEQERSRLMREQRRLQLLLQMRKEREENLLNLRITLEKRRDDAQQRLRQLPTGTVVKPRRLARRGCGPGPHEIRQELMETLSRCNAELKTLEEPEPVPSSRDEDALKEVVRKLATLEGRLQLFPRIPTFSAVSKKPMGRAIGVEDRARRAGERAVQRAKEGVMRNAKAPRRA